MGKGHPCSGCGIVLVCLDIASEDNSLSAHILTVTPGKQTGNLILLKWNLRFWKPQSNPQGDLKSSSSAAVFVINNNNSNDNSFPRLQKPSGTYFSVSWIWSGETDNLQFTPKDLGCRGGEWLGWNYRTCHSTARNNIEGLSSFVVLVVCHPSQRAVGKA